MKSSFGLANIGISSAAALSAFLALAPMTANAQAEDRQAQAQSYTPQAPNEAVIGQKNEDDQDFLRDHWEFLNAGCCGAIDVVRNIEVIDNTDEASEYYDPTIDPVKFPISIMLYETQFGIPLSGPYRIDIEASKVRGEAYYLEKCKNKVEAAEAAGVETSCVATSESVVFLKDNFKPNADGSVTFTQNGVSQTADVLPVEVYKNTALYCVLLGRDLQ